MRMKTSPPLRVRKSVPAVGQLIEHVFHFGGGHLALIVVVEIAVHTALVAPVSDV